jgi:hypothetical protein
MQWEIGTVAEHCGPQQKVAADSSLKADQPLGGNTQVLLSGDLCGGCTCYAV